VFFSAAAIAGSFGGLLAAAIEQLDGIGGRRGWAWLFIIVGLLTSAVGLASFWVINDFPMDAKFLSEEDRSRVINRLREDKQSSAGQEDFGMGAFWSAARDWKMWLGMAVYMGATVPLYAFSLFLPSIVRELGWATSIVSAQLYSVAPYVSAAVVTILIGYLADHFRTRGMFNIASSMLASIGFAMLLGSTQPAIQYAGTFLAAAGTYPCISNTITWMSNNVEGVYRRGIILGFVIGWGNLNGIISANIYFSPPRYIEGHAVVLAFLVVFLLGGSLLMTSLLQLENKKRRLGRRSYVLDGKTKAEIDNLGDLHPEFVYTT
jgi:MFS family permease